MVGVFIAQFADYANAFNGVSGSIFSQFDELSIYTYGTTVNQRQDYLAALGDTTTRTLTRLEELQGTTGGPPVYNPMTVGPTVNGEVFDPGTQPFKIVYSKTTPVIQGWISILGKMSQGDKIKVLIPSKMGYGARGGGPIQPYTPLVFDMELISVKSNK